MYKVEIYTKHFCPYCIRAKQLLDDKGVSYEEFEVSIDRSLQTEMQTRSSRRTVPQIFIDGLHIGGSNDLFALERSGELDSLLQSRAA